MKEEAGPIRGCAPPFPFPFKKRHKNKQMCRCDRGCFCKSPAHNSLLHWESLHWGSAPALALCGRQPEQDSTAQPRQPAEPRSLLGNVERWLWISWWVLAGTRRFQGHSKRFSGWTSAVPCSLVLGWGNSHPYFHECLQRYTLGSVSTRSLALCFKLILQPIPSSAMVKMNTTGWTLDIYVHLTICNKLSGQILTCTLKLLLFYQISWYICQQRIIIVLVCM